MMHEGLHRKWLAYYPCPAVPRAILVSIHCFGCRARQQFRPFLSYAENSGALFGWTVGWPEPLRMVVFSLALLLALALAWLIFRSLAPGEWLSSAALGLFAGGAASNVVDRFRLGASLDLFRMPFPAELGEYAPVFNPADFFIAVGGILLLLELWVREGRARAATTPPPEH